MTFTKLTIQSMSSLKNVFIKIQQFTTVPWRVILKMIRNNNILKQQVCIYEKIYVLFINNYHEEFMFAFFRTITMMFYSNRIYTIDDNHLFTSSKMRIVVMAEPFIMF